LHNLNGKVAVITGALGLIGRAHCHAFAAAGATVAVSDLDDRECKQFARVLATTTGAVAFGHGADITNEESVSALRDAVLQRVGQIDVLLNNAAINDVFVSDATPSFENYPLPAFQRTMNVNVAGTFLVCRIIGETMSRDGGGSIINVASTYGLVGPDQSIYKKSDGSQTFYKSAAYAASKGAVVAFTKYLATYWGSRGVRVNCLCPGGVANGQEEYFVRNYESHTPLGRMAAPEEIARAAVFLASDASSYMTGSNLIVDGGWTAW